MKYTCSMETVQQNGRFTLFSSKFLSIDSILFAFSVVWLTKTIRIYLGNCLAKYVFSLFFIFYFIFMTFPEEANFENLASFIAKTLKTHCELGRRRKSNLCDSTGTTLWPRRSLGLNMNTFVNSIFSRLHICNSKHFFLLKSSL